MTCEFLINPYKNITVIISIKNYCSPNNNRSTYKINQKRILSVTNDLLLNYDKPIVGFEFIRHQFSSIEYDHFLRNNRSTKLTNVIRKKIISLTSTLNFHIVRNKLKEISIVHDKRIQDIKRNTL